jgi:hypothetical protein
MSLLRIWEGLGRNLGPENLYSDNFWGTMLQAGMSPVRDTDDVDFFNLPNPSSCTMALGSTQHLTEMSTRNLPGNKKRPAHRADNFTAICEPNV